jgi:hypothetical protein
MSAATVRLNGGTAIALDPVRQTRHTTKGVLLTLEGRTPGDTMNCAVIPLDRVRAVIASLELVADQAARA